MSMEVTRRAAYSAYSRAESREAERVPDGGEKISDKNAEYLKGLNKKFPELGLEAGMFLSAQNDGKISFKIHPAILEKMQNDPAQEKETLELLEGAVQARRLIAALHKATDREYEYSHDYIDENGNFCHTARSVRKDTLNEELRKKNAEDTEKRVSDAIEKLRVKRKELIDMIKSDTAAPTEAKNTDTLELSEGAISVLKKAPAPAEERAAETEEADGEISADESEGESESVGRAVGVNAGKRARMIAAASTPAEVNVVLQMLQQDLAECREGLENGWCDESEVQKVEALIEMANKKMSEVAGNDGEENKGIDAFQMSMLF